MSVSIAFQDAIKILNDFVANEQNVENVQKAADIVANAFQTGNKILIAGNGGSAADAMHFAEEFTGRYRKDRRPLPAISLTDSTAITCIGNDYGFDQIFSRNVEAFGKENDVFIGISTSGNSPNIINAIEKAKKLGLKTIALLGKDGGALKGKSGLEFIVQAKTSDRIQEIHMTILHIVIETVERILFPENY